MKTKRRFMHGKRRRRSPLKDDPQATRPLTGDEKKRLEGNIGSAPSSGKAAVEIGKKAFEIGDKVADATIESKEKEAKTGFTGRKI
jgi:hypothetical protein